MGNIVLFDMDGTLTEPRSSFAEILMGSMRDLCGFADIGIVTGSDMDYVQEQLAGRIGDPVIRFNLHLMPCNGTKYYAPPAYYNVHHALVHETSMRAKLGESKFKLLMKTLIEKQSSLYMHDGFPLTGHFISYRGSMINWCPIGRNAETADRAAFIDYDTKYRSGFRLGVMNRLKETLMLRGLDNLEVRLGGDTSFDIFPTGWDKTYALNHFANYYQIWFVGDRTGENGNDKEIYEKLQPSHSFSTSGPEHTKYIIHEVIMPRLKSKEFSGEDNE